MGTQPDELRSEVEHTRAHLARNVDLLAERVAPRRVARRKAHSAQNRLRGIKEHVMGSGKDSRSSLSSTAHDVAGSAGQSAGQVGEKAMETAGRARDTAAGMAQDTADRAKEKADKAKGKAGQLGSAAQHAPARMRAQTQGSPLAAGVIAFGAGMLAAAFLPASKAEERVGEQLKEHSGELLEPVKQTAHDMQEGMRGPANEAVEAVKSAAQGAAQTTKEEARGAGQDTAQGLREAGTEGTQPREP
jgi:ElaB/YqjD/DUF883 family membrane-anchored ribosome-binding protein